MKLVAHFAIDYESRLIIYEPPTLVAEPASLITRGLKFANQS
jgi:hypothetical protein